MIAGNCGNPIRRSELAQPLGGKDEFLGKAEIDKVTSHGNVVWSTLRDIAGQHVEDIAAMHELSPAMPIDVAEHALAYEVAPSGPRHRAQMNVGQGGEGEHRGVNF